MAGHSMIGFNAGTPPPEPHQQSKREIIFCPLGCEGEWDRVSCEPGNCDSACCECWPD